MFRYPNSLPISVTGKWSQPIYERTSQASLVTSLRVVNGAEKMVPKRDLNGEPTTTVVAF